MDPDVAPADATRATLELRLGEADDDFLDGEAELGGERTGVDGQRVRQVREKWVLTGRGQLDA